MAYDNLEELKEENKLLRDIIAHLTSELQEVRELDKLAVHQVETKIDIVDLNVSVERGLKKRSVLHARTDRALVLVPLADTYQIFTTNMPNCIDMVAAVSSWLIEFYPKDYTQAILKRKKTKHDSL